MVIVIFDTETTSLEKPFAYDIGYTIFDTDQKAVLLKRSYVVEQVWHNKELFCSAYYADKRTLYISEMRQRNILMEKFGYITQQMCRDFKAFNVEGAYAYNSSFDEKVFNFCCDWFKCKNPFDTIPIFDIRGYVHKFLAFDSKFQMWAELHNEFTESFNFSTTAQTIYRYITDNPSFEEAHTALADSEIELEILLYCIDKGAHWNTAYKVYRTITRPLERILELRDADGNTTEYPYQAITIYQEKGCRRRIVLRKPKP